MNTTNNKQESTLRQRFEQYSIEPSTSVWKGIEAKTPVPVKIMPKFRTAKWLAGAAIITSCLIIYFALKQTNNADFPAEKTAPVVVQDVKTTTGTQKEQNTDISNKETPQATASENTTITPVLPADHADAIPDDTKPSPIQSPIITKKNLPESTGTNTNDLPSPNDRKKTTLPENIPSDDKKDADPITIEQPTLTPAQPITIFAGEEITLTASGAQSYKWNNGSSSNSILVSPKQTTTYQVTTTLSDNTTTTLSANVEVIPIWIPKAFSPDNDGINDLFKPEGYYKGNFTMQVFSRGGQMVFESNDINLGWDGTYRGEKMPDGVYAYVISVSDSKGNARTKKGAVTLLRK